MIDLTWNIVDTDGKVEPTVANRRFLTVDDLPEPMGAAITAAAEAWQNQQDVKAIVELASLPPLDFDLNAVIDVTADGTVPVEAVQAMEREWAETWGNLNDPDMQLKVQSCCERMRKRQDGDSSGKVAP